MNPYQISLSLPLLDQNIYRITEHEGKFVLQKEDYTFNTKTVADYTNRSAFMSKVWVTVHDSLSHVNFPKFLENLYHSKSEALKHPITITEHAKYFAEKLYGLGVGINNFDGFSINLDQYTLTFI